MSSYIVNTPFTHFSSNCTPLTKGGWYTSKDLVPKPVRVIVGCEQVKFNWKYRRNGHVNAMMNAALWQGLNIKHIIQDGNLEIETDS